MLWVTPSTLPRAATGTRHRESLGQDEAGIQAVRHSSGSLLLFSSPLNPDFVNSYWCEPQDSGDAALPSVLPPERSLACGAQCLASRGLGGKRSN